MTKPTLRLGPLPEVTSTKLTITLPATVKADLDRYAQVFEATHGKAVEVTDLVPYMVATFMARDRAFQQATRSSKNKPAR